MDILSWVFEQFFLQIQKVSLTEQERKWVENDFVILKNNLKLLIEDDFQGKEAVLQMVRSLCFYAAEEEDFNLTTFVELVNYFFQKSYGNPYVDIPYELPNLKKLVIPNHILTGQLLAYMGFAAKEIGCCRSCQYFQPVGPIDRECSCLYYGICLFHETQRPPVLENSFCIMWTKKEEKDDSFDHDGNG